MNGWAEEVNYGPFTRGQITQYIFPSSIIAEHENRGQTVLCATTVLLVAFTLNLPGQNEGNIVGYFDTAEYCEECFQTSDHPHKQQLLLYVNT